MTPLYPRTTDWLRAVSAATAEESNDYLLDRDEWRNGISYSGLPSIPMEDQAVTESMGTTYDRSREHLGTSDSMIIGTRSRLLLAAEVLQKEGSRSSRSRQSRGLPSAVGGTPSRQGDHVGVVRGHGRSAGGVRRSLPGGYLRVLRAGLAGRPNWTSRPSPHGHKRPSGRSSTSPAGNGIVQPDERRRPRAEAVAAKVASRSLPGVDGRLIPAWTSNSPRDVRGQRRAFVTRQRIRLPRLDRVPRKRSSSPAELRDSTPKTAR